jgi:hypothetical protein
MSILRQIFGPSKEDIWRQLSDQIGGDFVQTGFLKTPKVEVHHKEWTITLDTFTESTGETSQTYTRMRAPYVNKDGFRFTIYRKGFFSEFGKLLGMQDIEIGEPEFDAAFIIKGNDVTMVRNLFSNRTIRHLIDQQPKIYFTVKDDDGGWFRSRFPEGVDELYFRVPGVIKDMERLKSLYGLFAEVLNHLCHIGSSYENDPGVTL